MVKSLLIQNLVKVLRLHSV